MPGFKFLKRRKISRLPKKPGVYCFKRGKKFLYIGKATNLRERIKNHFQPIRPGSGQATFKDSLFINKVTAIGYISTNSEIEALILEANLIKKYRPKYNVLWRDDKNYFFVGITQEEFPKIFLTHQTKLKTKNYKLKTNFVGPFVDGSSLKQTSKILRKVFPYRSCNKIPKHPCLWYQLDRCLAPCLLKSGVGEQIPTVIIRTKRECQRNAKNLLKIFQGKKNEVLENLKREMKRLSKSQDFERAAKIRDQIRALEKVLAHAKIFEILEIEKPEYLELEKNLKKLLKTRRKIERIEAYDVSNIQGQEATGSMVTFIRGLPNKNFYRKFKIKISGKPNDVLMLKEILKRRFKHPEWPYPDLILIDGGKAQLNAALKIKNIKVVALAKKENKLFIEGWKQPVLLKDLPREVFNLILQLRDEAHRFARKYHLKLRKRALFLE